MVSRTPTTEPVIGSDGEVAFPPGMGWETIANELAAEVTRLHNEIDRLKGGDSKAPLTSKADWTHPLYPTWIEMGLDDLTTLQSAWASVLGSTCPKCTGALFADVYVAPMVVCPDCQLCFEARDGHFALDTVERAMERGPDA